jgi:putative membrane protein
MKRTLPIFTALLMGCVTGAYAQSPKSAADMQFVKAAAAGGLAEVKLGQLAADKGSSDFVKSFGQKMVADHGKANDDLKAVAAKDNIDLPTDVMPKDQMLYDKLSKLSGTQFDTAYLSAMKMDHKKDVAAFTKESTSGKNPDVKDFAAKTLPVVQSHLQMLDSQKMM